MRSGEGLVWLRFSKSHTPDLESRALATGSQKELWSEVILALHLLTHHHLHCIYNFPPKQVSRWAIKRMPVISAK